MVKRSRFSFLVFWSTYVPYRRKKLTFAISSPDEFLLVTCTKAVVLLPVNGEGSKIAKVIKDNVNHTKTAWMLMLVRLTLPFYDFCGFRSVAVNNVYKLQFFTFIFSRLNMQWVSVFIIRDTSLLLVINNKKWLTLKCKGLVIYHT